MRNYSDKSCRENQNTHFMFNSFFFYENRAISEKMWKNIVEPDRPRTEMWHMRIASRIPKSTDTYLYYVVLIAFPIQQWLHEGVHHCYVLVHCLYFFLFHNVPTQSWPSLSHLFSGCQTLFPGIQRPDREGDYSPTRSARAKNAYSSVSTLSCVFMVQSLVIFLIYISHVKMCSRWKCICIPTLTRHWAEVIS